MKKVITIGREFGSGGREIGRRIAEKLQIVYYDQEIVTEIAKRTKLSEEYVERISEDRPYMAYPVHAGMSFHTAYYAYTDIEISEWQRYFDINIIGTVSVTKSVIGKMLENKYGRIINVASVAGVYGNANMSAYSATKGALISFTKALAKEVANKGILVNSVSPGSVSPSENRDVNYTESSELSFMGRTGSDMENANLICFLASNDASYISRQNIQIDGCRKKQ